MEGELLLKLITEIGFGGIFLYLFLQVRREAKEAIEKKEGVINKKDDIIKSDKTKLIELVEQNMRTNEQLKSVVANNTESTKTLIQNISFILQNREKND